MEAPEVWVNVLPTPVIVAPPPMVPWMSTPASLVTVVPKPDEVTAAALSETTEIVAALPNCLLNSRVALPASMSATTPVWSLNWLIVSRT